LQAAKQQGPDEVPAEPNPYHPACMRLACPWLTELVEIHWHYYWWPDGMYSELGRVSVVHEGMVRGEVNVEELFRQRLEGSLAEVIVEQIVAVCSKVTGKRQRPSKRGYRSRKTAEQIAAADRPRE
jgi:hypothetical protein